MPVFLSAHAVPSIDGMRATARTVSYYVAAYQHA